MKNETQNEVLKQSRQALKEGFLNAFGIHGIYREPMSKDEVFDMMEMVFFPLGKKNEDAFHLRWNFGDQNQWTPKMLKHLASALYSDHDGLSDDPDNFISDEEMESGYFPTKSEWEDRWLEAYGETVETFLDPSLWDCRIGYFGFGESKGFFEAMSSFRGRENLWSGLCLEKAFASINLSRLKFYLEQDSSETEELLQGSAIGYCISSINENCFQWKAKSAKLHQDFGEDLKILLDTIQDAVLNHTVFQDGWILKRLFNEVKI